MWAYIKDNKIEQIYQRPKSIMLNNVRYPSNMFTKYTDNEKAAIGIYPVEDSGTKGDDKFEYTSQDRKGNKIYNYGLKTMAKEKAKQQANNYISRFNWLVERLAYDSSKTIPSAVTTYVAAIRTDCANIETAIDNASDMAAFKKLYDWEYNSDGSVKTIAPIQNWSDDYDVQKYIR